MLKEKFLAAWKWLHFNVRRVLRLRGHGISILVPLYLDGDTDYRAKNWKWLSEYWRSNLPGAEVIIGEDHCGKDASFSKAVAINNAASRAHGDIFVIVDADALLPIESIERCAKEIRLAENKGRSLWFIPYRKLFRLTKEASEQVLASDPKSPAITDSSPKDIENTGTFHGTPVSQIGHWYGAMAQVISRYGFFVVGGWDSRFRGWGGEDHAAMTATDTLYGPHKTLPDRVIHLWHPTMIPEGADDSLGKKRLWRNQTSYNVNNALNGRYYWSRGNPDRMRKLVNECREPKRHNRHRHRHRFRGLMSC